MVQIILNPAVPGVKFRYHMYPQEFINKALVTRKVICGAVGSEANKGRVCAGSDRTAGSRIMESWFLADVEILREYYGPEFASDRLPAHPNVEDAPKTDVERGLKEATRRTRKGQYHKTAHAPDILAKLRPDLVRKRAPNCNRLFDTLLARLAD
jgi:hypothetical protein